MSTFYVPAINLIGKGVINEVGSYVKELGYKKALLVTDTFIASSDILPKVTKPLDAEGIDYVVFSDVDPNPSCKKTTATSLFPSVVVHRKTQLAVSRLWQPMVVSLKTTKACTNQLRKVCQLWRSTQRLGLLLKLPLTMLLPTKNVRLKWSWLTRIVWR